MIYNRLDVFWYRFVDRLVQIQEGNLYCLRKGIHNPLYLFSVLVVALTAEKPSRERVPLVTAIKIVPKEGDNFKGG